MGGWLFFVLCTGFMVASSLASFEDDADLEAFFSEGLRLTGRQLTSEIMQRCQPNVLPPLTSLGFCASSADLDNFCYHLEVMQSSHCGRFDGGFCCYRSFAQGNTLAGNNMGNNMGQAHQTYNNAYTTRPSNRTTTRSTRITSTPPTTRISTTTTQATTRVATTTEASTASPANRTTTPTASTVSTSATSATSSTPTPTTPNPTTITTPTTTQPTVSTSITIQSTTTSSATTTVPTTTIPTTTTEDSTASPNNRTTTGTSPTSTSTTPTTTTTATTTQPTGSTSTTTSPTTTTTVTTTATTGVVTGSSTTGTPPTTTSASTSTSTTTPTITTTRRQPTTPTTNRTPQGPTSAITSLAPITSTTTRTPPVTSNSESEDDQGSLDTSRTQVQRQILNIHNRVRRQAGASNMVELTWDEEAAAAAQAWADRCQGLLHGGQSAGCGGQNLAIGSQTWSGALNLWIEERNDFPELNQNPCPADVDTQRRHGHYTQMVWATTTRVGCASAACPNNGGPLFVCNYCPSGNNLPTICRPFTPGPACGACGGTADARCQNSLCTSV